MNHQPCPTSYNSWNDDLWDKKQQRQRNRRPGRLGFVYTKKSGFLSISCPITSEMMTDETVLKNMNHPQIVLVTFDPIFQKGIKGWTYGWEAVAHDDDRGPDHWLRFVGKDPQQQITHSDKKEMNSQHQCYPHFSRHIDTAQSTQSIKQGQQAGHPGCCWLAELQIDADGKLDEEGKGVELDARVDEEQQTSQYDDDRTVPFRVVRQHIRLIFLPFPLLIAGYQIWQLEVQNKKEHGSKYEDAGCQKVGNEDPGRLCDRPRAICYVVLHDFCYVWDYRVMKLSCSRLLHSLSRSDRQRRGMARP